MLGTNPIALSLPFVFSVATSKRSALSNLGVNGTGIVGQANGQIYPRAIFENFTYMMLTGINDRRTWYASSVGKTSYQNALTACLAWTSIVDTDKVKAQSSSVSYVGSWNNTSMYGGNLGKNTTTDGTTATFVVTGSTIIVGTSITTTGGGSFHITIDGNPQADISCLGGAADVQGLTYSPQVNIYTGLSNTAHTVVLTSVSPSAEICYFDWAVGLDSVPTNYPTVYVGNCLRLTSAGYATYGGSDSDTAYWNTTLIPNAISPLTSIGLNIIACDISSIYDPNVAGNCQADGLHPTQQGHDLIANKFLTYM